MQSPITYSALLAASLSIIAKMLYFLFFTGDEDMDMYVRFFYLFCFLAALFLGIRKWKTIHGTAPFTEDIKAGMKIASIYALVISGFTWLYYGKIDQAYFKSKIEERVTAAKDALVAGDANTTNVDLEQIEQTASFIFNASTHASLTLFGLLVIGFFYTVVISLIFRWRPNIFGLPI
jgi:hypothetical protein